MNEERLRAAADAVLLGRGVDMSRYADISNHQNDVAAPDAFLCQSPMCVLGHVAFYTESPFGLRLVKCVSIWAVELFDKRTGRAAGMDDSMVCDYFDISTSEACELFSISGCGDASTPQEVRDYIFEFIERKKRENQHVES